MNPQTVEFLRQQIAKFENVFEQYETFQSQLRSVEKSPLVDEQIKLNEDAMNAIERGIVLTKDRLERELRRKD